MKTKEIIEGIMEQITNEGINKDTLYSIKDYPIGGITNQQMQNALLDKYLGFYPINAVFTCVDDGVYIKNHLYKFTKIENTYIWEDITISSGSSGGGSNVEINSTDTPVGVANFIKVNGLNYEIGGIGNNKTIYSTEETVIGTYLDKPLYRKVFILSTNINISNTNWTNSTISIVNNNIDYIINARAISKVFGNLLTDISDGKTVYCLASRASNNINGVNTIILEYTKTTD